MNWLRWAFIFLAAGVVLGAFGAHSLKAKLSADALSAWQTAVMYLLIHSLGLVLLQLADKSMACFGSYLKWINVLIFCGVLCFSGSIFLLTTKELHGCNVRFLGPVTPLGGICFIAAWVMAAVTCRRKAS
jgi:uncharacterized membrane protein YgdD (TMEM256/DUF423 family)